MATLTRRHLVLAAGTALLARPDAAHATPERMRAAIAAFTGGAPIRDGRITLDIATLVDNGNTVPVAVRVDSPMTAADHVQRIAVFSELNPNTEVAVFHLGPRSGRAAVQTRMRLATSQRLTAVAALSDGSHWQHSVDVVVTLAACIEGG
jgi:sulfur-oxidizing protein SoxY